MNDRKNTLGIIFSGGLGFLLGWLFKRCPAATQLTGTVRESIGLAPLPGAVVQTDGQQAVTDPSGRYVLSISPGVYDLLFAYTGAMTPVSVTLEIFPGQNTYDVIMDLHQD